MLDSIVNRKRILTNSDKWSSDTLNLSFKTAETVGWIICGVYIIPTAASGWLNESRDSHVSFFSSSSSLHPPHLPYMWNTSELGHYPHEFSMTFLGQDDKSNTESMFLIYPWWCVGWHFGPRWLACRKNRYVRVEKVSCCCRGCRKKSILLSLQKIHHM